MEEVPLFSPLGECVKPGQGISYDYQGVGIGFVRCPLREYINDGPRWYDSAAMKFMLETGGCKWRHVKFGLQTKAQRPAADLVVTLQKIRSIRLEVDQSFQAEIFCGKKGKRKFRSELLNKTALLSMLGNWQRTENHRHAMTTTSHADNISSDGKISPKPTPRS